MNRTEFVAEFIKTAGVVRAELDDLTMEAYFEHLCDWDISTFRDVMKLVREDCDRFPSLAEIRRIRFMLRTPQSRVIYDYEPRFECPNCEDRGYVEIYHPIGYQRMKTGSFEIGKHLRTCTVNCFCDSGLKRKEKSTRLWENPKVKNKCRSDIDFDGNVMKQVTKRIPGDQVAELQEFVETEWNPRTVEYGWIP